jgi:hypothetical protein
VGGYHIIHCQPPWISVLTCIYYFNISLAVFANVHPVEVFALTIEVAQILLFLCTAKGTL